MAAGDPLRLPRITVLLPTRRAVRGLREAFLRVAPGGAPLLLPRLRPVGDLDSDELSFADQSAGGDALAVPPVLPALRRILLLTRLVLRWGGGYERLLPGQAAALAAALARFLDTAATEGADLASLRDLVPEELADHWQAICKFLEIMTGAWPPILAAEGALEPAERRNRLLLHQAALWRRAPPVDPVVAAGLSGGIPAIGELLSVVAGLDNGLVILPGLDRVADAAEWAAIERDETHPQHLAASLLQSLDAAREDVAEWPVAPHPPAARVPPSPRKRGEGRDEGQPGRRLHLLREALRPATTTDAWRRLPSETPDALAGVSRYECTSAQHEAMTIALLLRRKLETPGATAALVTPDRELARRVAAELRRWNIAIDDSAGTPLALTPPGAFLRLVADLAASGLAPVPLLATLKHPLAAGGIAPARFRDFARRLELAILGPRPAPGFAGLRAALGGNLRGFVDRLAACLGHLPELVEAVAVPLDRLVVAHLEAAERVAASDAESGAERLWADEAGEAAARFCHELSASAHDFPPLPGRDYPALFEALLAGAVVRPAWGRHPRLAIWGLLEARLQQADLVVLGGLNEGSWPGSAAPDPWMSRQMRRDLGIAVPERALGIAAHDFAQAMAAPEVAMTRAARQEGVPTVPSRWLLRLDTVLRAVGLEDRLAPDPSILDAASLIDEPLRFRPAPLPEPRPPLAARPRRLSVTQVETWLRDPYAIYARHILGLRALDELDADPGRAELGIVIHDALEKFLKRFPRGLPEDTEAQFLEIGRESFGPMLSRPGAWAFWWPRFERIAHWLVGEERTYRGDVAESLGECQGSLVLDMPGGPFELTAIADRIDRLAAGGFRLIDYKTGALPKSREVKDGVAPQLPLEAAILRDGRFGALSGAPCGLEYWRLSGGNPPGERRPVGGDDPPALIALVLDRLRALIARFDDPATPYLAVPVPQWEPRFSDYRHLERLGAAEEDEWP